MADVRKGLSIPLYRGRTPFQQQKCGDQAASDLISGLLIAWAAADEFPGLLRQSLPAGLVERDMVTIVRK